MSLSSTATSYHHRGAFLVGALLALVMGFGLCSKYEDPVQALFQGDSLLSVSTEDAQSLQNAAFYSAAGSVLEAPMADRGSLDNDADNDGNDDGVADLWMGLAPTLLLTPLLMSSFLVPFYEPRKLGSDYASPLERPG